MKKILESDTNSVELAVDFLKNGKIIAFATDTVYGFAVDASNYDAIEKLYDLKQRDENKPIAIFVSDLDMAKKILVFNELAEKVAKKFFSQSLTLVLEKLDKPLINLASNLNRNNKFLGFRIVENKFIKNLLKEFGGIIAVTSANISGESDNISASEIEKVFVVKKPDLLIDSGVCKEKIPSTVIKIDGLEMSILRTGVIDKNLINQFVQNENSI